MQSYLEAKGYEVVSAGTCKDAISVTEKEKPDIMLLDRRLPDGDGLDLLEKIRQS
jgi:DNA-binding response OmpR family regulator